MSTISSLNPIIWYDPSDWSTLFQDSAGTIPVTAVGDPVGLMLDKSVSLTWISKFSTDFSSTPSGWSFTNATISGGTLNLSPSATVVMPTTPAPTIGRRYKITYTITAITPGASNIRFFVGTNAGVVRTTIGTFTDYITYTSGAASFYSFTGGAFVSGVVDNLVIEEMIGNHAYQSTAINRPTLEQDANGKYYLAFNGTNTRMQSGAIGFTSNALTLVAGVYKASDAATGVIIEASADASANNGAFYLQAANAAGANYQILVRGSASDTSTPSVAAPDVSVISVSATLGATGSLLVRRDATEITNSTPSFGAVNFGNYQLFIGHRSGGFLHFNGGLYGLIIRDTDSTTAEIEMMEQYMIARTHATPIPTSRMLTGVGK